MSKKLSIYLAFLIMCTNTIAAVELIPRKVLFGNPDNASPLISPDGKKLAYLAPEKGVLNIWVRTLGKSDDQVVTNDIKGGIHTFDWQEGSQYIHYLQDADGNENYHLYQTNLETRNTRDFTPFSGVKVFSTITESRFPEIMLVGLNLRDSRLEDIYRLNLKTGALELDTQNPGDVAGWQADNELNIRAAEIATADGGTLIRVRLSKKSRWKDFIKFGSDETVQLIGFSPDNKKLRLLSSLNANAARLVEINLRTKKQNVIAEDPAYDARTVTIHPKTKKIETVTFLKARKEIQVVDPKVRLDYETLAKLHIGDISVLNRDDSDKTWIVSYMNDNAPVSYYVFDRKKQKATYLFSNRTALEKVALGSMQPISFLARDGLTIYGYLTLPNNQPSKNLPLVLNVHGGPQSRDMWGLNPRVQWLANRGYAVLQVNYRGSIGYGKAYMSAGFREWGGKMQDDLTDGVKWAIEQGIADPNKICIFGGSYGGYAALAGATFTPDLYKCAVDIVGPSNLITMIETIPPYWMPIISMEYRRVGNPKTEPDFLKSRSPFFHADKIRIPLLVAQGANDPRVVQAESDQIVKVVRANGKTVDYLLFPDEGHGFAVPVNNEAFYARAEEFLARHLGGALEPASAAESKRINEVLK